MVGLDGRREFWNVPFAFSGWRVNVKACNLKKRSIKMSHLNKRVFGCIPVCSDTFQFMYMYSVV